MKGLSSSEHDLIRGFQTAYREPEVRERLVHQIAAQLEDAQRRTALVRELVSLALELDPDILAAMAPKLGKELRGLLKSPPARAVK